MATFTSSQQFLQWLQGRFGSANFAKWQTIRQPFYSFVNYPAAGANTFQLFGFATGGAAATNLQYTNMPKAGSFGQQMLLLKSLRFTYYWSNAQNILNAPLSAGAAADVNVAAAEFLHGFVQAGYGELDIGNKPYVQIPRPFMYAPPADGCITNVSTFGATLTLNNVGPPETLAQFDTLTDSADLERNTENQYIVDPPILIEPEQSFSLSVNYPSGAIPLIASTYFTNNFYIGAVMDGILIRPVS